MHCHMPGPREDLQSHKHFHGLSGHYKFMDRSMLQVFLGRIAQLKSCSVTWLRWCLAAMQRTKTLDNLHPLPPKLLPNLGFIWAQENWVGEIKLHLKSPMRKTDSCGKQANVAPTPKVQDSKNSCDSSFDTSVASPAYSRCPAAGVHVPTLEITPTVSNYLQAHIASTSSSVPSCQSSNRKENKYNEQKETRST